MTGTIIERTQRNGAGGSSRLYNYFVLKCETEEKHLKQILEPCADFPAGAEIGDRVQLDYIQVGNGMRWFPVAIIKEAA